MKKSKKKNPDNEFWDDKIVKKKDYNKIETLDKEDNLLEDLMEDDEVKSKKVSKTKKKAKDKIKGTSKKSKVKNKSKNTNKKGKKKKSIWKLLIVLFILFVVLAIFAVGGFLAYIVVTTTDFNPEALETQENTIVYSADGKEIANLGYEMREEVTYDQLPQVLIDAIVATEDSRFFQHTGVDLPRFLKASLGQLLGNDSAGGASTLTMQVVKNNLTSTERSIIRKFKDMYLATFFMERQYSKEEILEFYVNDSSLGSNVYGVEEASQYYFGKSVSELTLPEAALIAGLYQAPNGYNPYYYPEEANKRIDTVLRLMQRHGYITKEEAEIAGSIDISTLLVGLKDSDNKYQGYLDTVIEEVENKTGYSPYLVSMKIYTALDTNIQDGINGAFTGETYKWVNDVVQAGAAVIDCNTGQIVAVGTGRKENNDALTWNYATRTTRQPGSTAKPLFAYGPAFEYLNYSTYTLFNDEQWSYSNGTSISNWDNKYKGLMTLRDAVAQSRNIPALKAFQEVNSKVGNAKIVEFVENLGIELENDVAYESYSIGGLTKGVTPVQLASAYAAFANGGYYNTPHTVTKIEYRETGEVVEFEGENKKVMSETTAYLMNNTLEYAVNYGFHGGAKVSGSHVAAKTGTSNFPESIRKKYNMPANAENDLWTVAYTKNYSIALWYGYDDASLGYNTTDRYKNNLMSVIMKYIPKESRGWSVPGSVKAVKVENESWPAQLPSEFTPDSLISTEYFKSGTEPTDTSERFSKLEDVTNLKATSSNGSVDLVWDSNTPVVATDEYLTTYFKQSVFGKKTDSLMTDRLDYNSKNMGDFGFGIYLKDISGNLSRIGWTSENTYTYTPSSGNTSLTFVVKAEYKIFKANASDGVSKMVTVTGTSDNDDSIVDNVGLDIKINNSSLYLNSKDVTVNHFNYTVIYDSVDVTDEANVSFALYGNGISVGCNSLDELITEVRKLESGKNYTISYTAIYNGMTTRVIQNITIK